MREVGQVGAVSKALTDGAKTHASSDSYFIDPNDMSRKSCRVSNLDLSNVSVPVLLHVKKRLLVCLL